MIRNRWFQAGWWVMLLIAGLVVGGWFVWAGAAPADATPPTPWRSAGPYVPATTVMTPTVVLNVEASPHYDDVMLTVCRGATTSQNAEYLPLIRKPATPTATPTIVPTAAPLWPDPPTAIEVFSPLPQQYYRTPIDVNGLARTFEGNVYLRLLDANGAIIGQHRARAGMSDFAFFHGYLRFEVTQEISATLVVYEAAAPDQPPITQVQIPLYLQPGQRFVDLNSPVPGSKICGRVPVAGYSSTFEAVVVVELTTRNGALLAQTTTMGGVWGIYREFATHLDYAVTMPQAALVGAIEISPRAGEFVDHVRVPVSLYPAGSSACP